MDEDDLLFYNNSFMCDKLSSIQNATMLSFDYNIAKETFCASLIRKKCISGSTKYQISSKLFDISIYEYSFDYDNIS